MANNYIYEYHAKIQAGEITAGKWIKAIYEIIVTGLENDVYRFDAMQVELAIEFIENFCHHCEGRDDLLKLEIWQKSAVSAIFGIVDEDGIRVFREVFIIVARKNGKSLFASAIIAYMAYMDGEHGAKIYCLAPKLGQARIVFDNFYKMLEKKKVLLDMSHKRRSDIYVSETNTSIEPLPFTSKKSDGYNPHLVVNDEIASWAGESGLKQYEVMKSALGARRQPFILNISTAGYEDDGIFDELYTRSTAFLKGTSPERRLLPLLYMIDEDDVGDNWHSLEALKKSNPNIGVSVSEEFYREEIIIAKNSLSKKAEFLTKYCNIKQNSATAWLDRADVERASIEGLTLEDFRGCYAVGGIDLSQTVDLTAASILIERGRKLYSFCQFFLPANRLERGQQVDKVTYDIFVKKGIVTLSGENYVNYKDVLQWFIALRENYDMYILKVGYDRYSAQYLVDDMEDHGFRMDDVHQGENLTPIIREFEGIIKDGNLLIPGNNLLRAHFLNVALKQNAETRRIRPVKIEQRARIDGFVSVIDAMTVRMKHYAEIGDYLKNED